jgi:methylmalonyl-CoA mutase N-terminal domain/subunit
MFSDETIKKSRDLKEEWEAKVTGKYKEVKPSRTLSGLPINPVYTPDDIAHIDFEEIGIPGAYPYTRGIYPLHYQYQPWMMQQIHGYGLPEDTRHRMDLLKKGGMEGYFGNLVYNLVLDHPSQCGIDCDDPRAHGLVGVCGMTFGSLRDMEILVHGLELDKCNMSLITGDTCYYLLPAFIVAAEKQGYTRDRLRGNSMNWPLKGFCMPNPVFPPRSGLKLMVQLIRFCTKEMPTWNTTNFISYLAREAGANPVQELAFILQWAIATIEVCIAAGLDVDTVAPRFGFQISLGMHFFEDIAKIRALRRMYSKILRDRFGAKNPKAFYARMHVHTSGSAYTAQQPLNNITRGAILALAAAMAGTNSMNVCAYDEALGIPTEESHLLTLRTQQIVLHETDVTCVGDPLAGSYYLEDLTDKIEKAAKELIDKMDEMGGFVEAIESGWLQGLIAEQSYKVNEEIRKGEQILVGVNRYEVEEEPRPVFRVESDTEQKAIRRMRTLKHERDQGQVQTCLDQVRAIARGDSEELIPAIIEAARVYCTQQEVMDILKEEYGWQHMKNC